MNGKTLEFAQLPTLKKSSKRYEQGRVCSSDEIEPALPLAQLTFWADHKMN